MHFHFPFSTLTVLWTLTFAAHLVLLVVLMGRDRVRQFPWFTASIVLVALRLLTSRLLFGRLPQMTMAEVFVIMAAVGAFLSLMVVLEVARRAFKGVKRSSWLFGALVLAFAGAAVLRFWGAWPPWETLKSAPPLQLLQVIAQKGLLLADVENIGVGLLIVLFGRMAGSGFRSKPQQLAIGLMTASISQLGIQFIWERIAATTVPHTREEYERVLGLRDKLFNTNNAVYIAVLIWWIVCFWMEEKGRETGTTEQGAGTRDQGAAEPGEIAAGAAVAEIPPVAEGRELPRGSDETGAGDQG